VKAVKDIWTGPRTSAGREIYPPYMPGAESAAGGWNAYMSGSGPRSGNHWEQSDNVLRFMIFENPTWDFRTFDFDRDLEPALKKLGETMDAFNPDLSRFRQRGGKLLMYHGWSDPQVTPYNTINFFHKVLATQGGAGLGTSVQLYMVPGMNHCQGGPGTDSFDKMKAIEDWIKTGSAPNRIEAAHLTNGAIDRTRPLCPWGQVAKWNGTGSTDDAANFACVASTVGSAR
jgi:feruloyl esterase